MTICQKFPFEWNILLYPNKEYPPLYRDVIKSTWIIFSHGYEQLRNIVIMENF